MPLLSEFQYYLNSNQSPTDENWGSYQYTPLSEIINNYMLVYMGNQSLVNNVPNHVVLFHAKRAVQELHYDAFKEVKAMELKIEDSLRFILPRDYVNYVRISLVKEGILYPLQQNTQILGATSYEQDTDGELVFDNSTLTPIESSLDAADGARVFQFGRGADAQFSNQNPGFVIDKARGVINFTSEMAGESCIVEYISDGMESGDPSQISVNKLFEEYIYAYITYAILDSKLGVQEYVIRRALKKKTALLRNARIRISDMHPSRLLQTLRSQGNTIK